MMIWHYFRKFIFTPKSHFFLHTRALFNFYQISAATPNHFYQTSGLIKITSLLQCLLDTEQSQRVYVYLRTMSTAI